MLASILLLGSTQAQQTPPAKTPAPAATPAKSATAKTTHAVPAKKPATVTLKTQKDKVSYALGMNIGTNLQRQPVELDPALVALGLKDALSGGKMLLTIEEAQSVLKVVQDDLKQKQQAKMKEQEAKMKELGAANQKEGDEFLAANKAKDGVVTLPSGLQYKILQAGTGPKPAASDTVVCNYKGTLINGKEFDSSYKRNEPATFPVNGVIKGWTEALQLMSVGSKWQLFIPPTLAYGDRGAGADIGPSATLIFEVELVSIQAKEAAKPDSKDDKDEKK